MFDICLTATEKVLIIAGKLYSIIALSLGENHRIDGIGLRGIIIGLMESIIELRGEPLTVQCWELTSDDHDLMIMV